MTPRPSWYWWDDDEDDDAEEGAYGDRSDHDGDGGDTDDDSDSDDLDVSSLLRGKDERDPDRTRYYTRLHLDPNCDPGEISRAYKALSRVVHPDKQAATGGWVATTTLSSSISDKEDPLPSGANDDEGSNKNAIAAAAAAATSADDDLVLRSAAEDAFVELQRCAEVLSDPVLRLAYDVGGVSAVRLVQRSQQLQQQQPQNQPPHDTHSHNLYRKLSQAHTREEAVAYIRQALNEHRRREKQRHRGTRKGKHSGRIELDASLTAPYADWEREGGSNLSVVARRQVSARHSIYATASHRLQHGGLGQVSGSVGTELVVASSSVPPPSGSGNNNNNQNGASGQSGGTTTYAMDARFTESPRAFGVPSSKTATSATATAAPIVGFRTSRQLATGTTWVWGMSGRIRDRRTWNYTLVSHRLLQLQWPPWCGMMALPWNTTRQSSRTNDNDHNDNDDGNDDEHPHHRDDAAPQPLRVHAMLRWGWQAGTQRLGFVVAQFRTVGTSAADPLYRLRFSLNTPCVLKVSYRGCPGATASSSSPPMSSDNDESGTWTVTYSAGWGWLWNRFKVTRSFRVGGDSAAVSSSRWVCRYGVKYDSRALLAMLPTAGNALGAGPDGVPTLWTLLLHLHSPEWSIRIPIHLTAAAVVVPPSAAAMVLLLVWQWLRGMLEGWHLDNNSDIAARGASATAEAWAPSKGGTESVIASMTTKASDVVRHVAAKKRALELQSDGLVILSVAVNGERRESLTKALQFWISDGSLNVPMLHMVQPSAESRRPPKRESLWRRWWVRWVPPPPARSECSRPHVRLDLRYQYRGFVYDAQFSGDDEHLVLPVKDACRATRLGRSHEVQ